MKELEKLLGRIIQRVNINLREMDYDVTPVIKGLAPLDRMDKFYALCGISGNHPQDMSFQRSSLAGSYFLGKCLVADSILYKSDIRGDELKKKGDVFRFQNLEIPITRDEGFDIEDSLLIKTLVHSCSHDPETPERFFIRSTLSAHYANIHGSPCDGSFLGPFATVDLTTMSDCIIGAFSYVQAQEIDRLNIKPGTVWVRVPGGFDFIYRYDEERLKDYIRFEAGSPPAGIFIDLAENVQEDFQDIFDRVNLEHPVAVPGNSAVSRYAVIKPGSHISEDVLVAQRAFVQNSWLGQGANAQENCCIINSRLAGNNVTAHGGRIIDAELGRQVFVGFNSFIKGRPDARLKIGEKSIVMPHTIIDSREPVTIPDGYLVWGLITTPAEAAVNSMPLREFASISGRFSRGSLSFEGSGAAFVEGFEHRIHHILEANGAFFDASRSRGHAQLDRDISFNMLRPYSEGDLQGMYPAITIRP